MKSTYTIKVETHDDITGDFVRCASEGCEEWIGMGIDRRDAYRVGARHMREAHA